MMPGAVRAAAGAAQPRARAGRHARRRRSPLPVFVARPLAPRRLGDRGRALGRRPGASCWFLRQLPLGMGSLAASGAVAFGRMFRAVAVMVGPDRHHRLGLPPRAPRRGRVRARVHGRVRLVAGDVLRRGGRDLRLQAAHDRRVVGWRCSPRPRAASAGDASTPSSEFTLKDWVPIHVGGLDLSINKAVVYLLVGLGADLPARDLPDALPAQARSPGAARPSAR